MTDRLDPGQFIKRNTPDDRITSANGRYSLIMQNDGNLVIYNQGSAIWATNTAGTDGETAVMQTDGNFVLYRVNGTPLWASNTAGRPVSYVIMQDDGNLVVYQTLATWASNTAGQ
ncbi:lectin [Nannocystis punicea]|uniref:Lectin n=1 Tax=Nannocystis punicea TaxID=2995304 RepID=A0ABY7HBX2_9BACT|nr:lectin [Nannocystis poenicansa]WAS96580.1 lectin [Nannocystis poenicansa]